VHKKAGPSGAALTVVHKQSMMGVVNSPVDVSVLADDERTLRWGKGREGK